MITSSHALRVARDRTENTMPPTRRRGTGGHAAARREREYAERVRVLRRRRRSHPIAPVYATSSDACLAAREPPQTSACTFRNRACAQLTFKLTCTREREHTPVCMHGLRAVYTTIRSHANKPIGFMDKTYRL